MTVSVSCLSKKYSLSKKEQGFNASFKESYENLKKRIFSRTFSSRNEDFFALNKVSFEVKAGDRVALVGKNGAGKSTLLKILSRIVEPTEGRVRMRGRLTSLIEVGTGFHPDLTGRENVFLNGAILGMGRKEILSKFDRIVAFSGVESFIDTPVKRYSSGMFARLGFAIAAHVDPEIFIVDEVLGVGDAAFQEKCLKKMRELADEGRTIFFVGHQSFLLSSLCTRGLLLDRGSLTFDGGIHECLEEYEARRD